MNQIKCSTLDNLYIFKDFDTDGWYRILMDKIEYNRKNVVFNFPNIDIIINFEEENSILKYSGLLKQGIK